MKMAANSARWGGDREDDEDITIINECTVNARDNNDRAVNHGSVGHNYLTDHKNYE